jgi:valyl-tRNA synthetase
MSGANDPRRPATEIYNRWIRSRFAAACAAVHDGFDAFRIDEAALAAYRFFWNDLCVWYLEIVKPVLRRQTDGTFVNPAIVPETKATLAYVLEGSMRLLHPLLPFLTEELWQRMPRPASRKATIAFGPFPTKDDERHAVDADAESWMELLKSVVSAARTIRSEYDLKRAEVPLRVRSANAEVVAFLRAQTETLRTLTQSKGEPVLEAPGGPREAGTTVSVVPSPQGPIEVLVALKGLVTADAERARLDREDKRIKRDLTVIDKKLGAPGFVDRAPKEVVEESRAQRSALVDALGRLDAARKLVDEL